MPTFVLNDETKLNSHGFRLINAGIDFSRFDENPVMLDSHINTTDHVVGRWVNRRIVGSQLLMDTEFDTDLPDGKRLEGQVERKFVKGASPGIGIDFEMSFERKPDGSYDCVKSEMMEGTVCGVPSNAGALQLYDIKTGNPLTEADIKLSLQKLSANSLDNIIIPTMEKIILSTAALSVLVGLNVPTENITQSQISEAFVSLNAQLTASKTKVTELQGKIDAQVKLQAEALGNQFVLDGKGTAEEAKKIVLSALENYELTAMLVSKMPGKVSLSSKVTLTGEPTDAPAFKTLDEFQGASTAAQLAFKNEHPDQYKALFKK